MRATLKHRCYCYSFLQCYFSQEKLLLIFHCMWRYWCGGEWNNSRMCESVWKLCEGESSGDELEYCVLMEHRDCEITHTYINKSLHLCAIFSMPLSLFGFSSWLVLQESSLSLVIMTTPPIPPSVSPPRDVIYSQGSLRPWKPHPRISLITKPTSSQWPSTLFSFKSASEVMVILSQSVLRPLSQSIHLDLKGIVSQKLKFSY